MPMEKPQHTGFYVSRTETIPLLTEKEGYWVSEPAELVGNQPTCEDGKDAGSTLGESERVIEILAYSPNLPCTRTHGSPMIHIGYFRQYRFKADGSAYDYLASNNPIMAYFHQGQHLDSQDQQGPYHLSRLRVIVTTVGDDLGPADSPRLSPPPGQGWPGPAIQFIGWDRIQEIRPRACFARAELGWQSHLGAGTPSIEVQERVRYWVEMAVRTPLDNRP